MIKVRLEGLPVDLSYFVQWLTEKQDSGEIEILLLSGKYPNRDNKYCRRYLEVEIKDPKIGDLAVKRAAMSFAKITELGGA